MSFLVIGGTATLAAYAAIAISQAPLGSPLYFCLAAAASVIYLVLLVRLPGNFSPGDPRTASSGRLPAIAIVFAVAFRIPLAVPPVRPDNDMVRYLWDGRVQRLGLNPFSVVPADPSLAWTHTEETRRMPSRRVHTPYPAAAQLFFRLVATVHDSSRAMKLALILCDLLTIFAVRAWLAAAGRPPWLTLVYAWNPLVILEVAYSGHVDALGALWLAVSAWLLTSRRPTLASMAYVLAVATKLLPIVLLPLFWRRVRLRDAAAGAALLVLLYLPFAGSPALVLGAVPNVVDYIRFNGPLFHEVAAVGGPRAAAAAAVTAGLVSAAWLRRRSVGDPSAWAWPMAIALAAAPVVYPWYLLYLTPFLGSIATAPILAWTFSVQAVYAVWDLSRHGHRWVVPAGIEWLEYGTVAAALVVMRIRRRRIDAVRLSASGVSASGV